MRVRVLPASSDPEPLASDVLTQLPQSRTTIREDILAGLREADRELPADPTRANALDRLADGAHVVVTGQQPGVLGGPALSLYKIATALAATRHLRAAGIDVVCVYWNASEDHDVDEADRFYHQEHDGSVRLHRSGFHELSGTPLDRVVIDGSLVEKITELMDLAGTQDASLRPFLGESIGQWHGRLMSQWFHGEGLVIVEPRHLAAATLSWKLQILERHREIQEALTAATQRRRVGGGATPIAEPGDDATECFAIADDRRQRIRVGRGNHWVVAGRQWSREELTAWCREDPRRLSCSVIARPVVQNLSLPILIQVVGPTEAAYLEQIEPVQRLLGVAEPPLLWPRMTATVLRADQSRFLEDRVIDLDDDPKTIIDRIAPRMPDDWRRGLEMADRLVRVARERAATNRDTSPRAASARRELVRRAHAFRRDVERRWKRDTREARQTLHRLREWLRPLGRPQDRVFSPVVLMPREPMALARAALAAAEPITCRGHRLLIDDPDSNREGEELR